MVNWKKPEELTAYNKPIICWNKYNKVGTFRDVTDKEHWEMFVKVYNIIYWIYQDEIAPKNLIKYGNS